MLLFWPDLGAVGGLGSYYECYVGGGEVELAPVARWLQLVVEK